MPAFLLQLPLPQSAVSLTLLVRGVCLGAARIVMCVCGSKWHCFFVISIPKTQSIDQDNYQCENALTVFYEIFKMRIAINFPLESVGNLVNFTKPTSDCKRK